MIKLDKGSMAHWVQIYSLRNDDIQYAKDQQWRVAYYSMLILAACIYLVQANSITIELRILLLIGAMVTTFASILLTVSIGMDIKIQFVI